PSTNAGLNNPVGNNSTVRKVNFAKDIKIMDLTVKRSKNGAVARFDIAKDCVVDNVTHINDGYVSGYTHLAVLSRCLNVEVRNSLYKLKHHENVISVLDHRNVFKIISSVSSGFKNCVSYNGTQSGDIAVLDGYIPSQQCYFIDCKMYGSENQGITTHQGNFMTLIKGNTIRGSRAGLSSRGKKAIITNNNLIGSLTTDVTFLSLGIGMYTRTSGDTI